MKGTIYKTIGIKGRTTIPFWFRVDLKIGDDTLLKFTHDGNKIMIIPMRECDGTMCEQGLRFSAAEEDIKEMIDSCSEDTLSMMLSAINDKLKLNAGKKIENTQR